MAVEMTNCQKTLIRRWAVLLSVLSLGVVYVVNTLYGPNYDTFKLTFDTSVDSPFFVSKYIDVVLVIVMSIFAYLYLHCGYQNRKIPIKFDGNDDWLWDRNKIGATIGILMVFFIIIFGVLPAIGVIVFCTILNVLNGNYTQFALNANSDVQENIKISAIDLFAFNVYAACTMLIGNTLVFGILPALVMSAVALVISAFTLFGLKLLIKVIYIFFTGPFRRYMLTCEPKVEQQ